MNYMKKFNIVLLAAIILLQSCGLHINGKRETVNHQPFTTLLQKHVTKDGLVNYKGFIADSVALQSYLNDLSKGAPAKNWTNDEKLAYWINAYNAFTIKLIVNNYPVRSIKDLGPNNQIIFVNTPWDKKFFTIGKKQMTLNNIEHRIIRNQFKDPRIHFALNCASMSCPQLRNEAYEGQKLNDQLNDQAKVFLYDSFRNKLNANNPKLSSIFKWYGMDFRKWTNGTVTQFLNKYLETKIADNANIDYLDYDWNLNEAK
jgi:hypothetical protein